MKKIQTKSVFNQSTCVSIYPSVCVCIYGCIYLCIDTYLYLFVFVYLYILLFLSGSSKECEQRPSVYGDTLTVTPAFVSDTLAWAKYWVSCVHLHQSRFQSGISLPIPPTELYFASLIDVLPLPQTITPLYRYWV